MDNKYPALKNAPITEAIIDIRVKLPDDFNVESLISIYNQTEYPYRKERRKWEGKIEFKKGDLVQFEKGLKCVWNVKKPVRKYFSFDLD